MSEPSSREAVRGFLGFSRAQWMLAGLGGSIGAAISLAVVFGAAALGAFPGSDARTHAYLLAHPDVLIAMTDLLQQQQADAEQTKRQAAVDKIGLAKFFDSDVAFVTGPKDAKKTVVEFYDYNCPYCRASLPAVKKFYEAHKNDTRFAFIEFPIKGPQSTLAAHVAIAARKQPEKYVAFHFALMGMDQINQDSIQAAAEQAGLDIGKLSADMQAPAGDKTVAAALRLAQEAGVDGTPTFIIDGKVYPGMIDDATFARLTKS